MEFLKKHWLTLLIMLALVIVLGAAIAEYLDAATSLLPGMGER